MHGNWSLAHRRMYTLRGRTNSALVLAAMLGTSLALCAQTAPPSRRDAGAADKRGAPSGRAPVRDLTGVWERHSPEGVFASGATYTKDPPELTPFGQQEFKKAKNSNGDRYMLDETNDPVLTKCYPPGVPRVYFHPYPFEFVQTPKEIIMLYEYDHQVRRIYTDGRPIPTDPDISWMGSSVGHWEGNDTLVVDTVGFNDKTWLDRLGTPHSTQLHVIERFHRVDQGHLELQVTMIDPKTLAKPWVGTLYYQLRPDWELGEISCSGDYLDFSKFEDPKVKPAPYNKTK